MTHVDRNLFNASKEGYDFLVNDLLAKGASVEYKCSLDNNSTPLHVAGNSEIAEILLENGANINSKDSLGDTPLHRVAGEGQMEIVKTLVRRGAKLSATNNQGDTPLHQAAENGLHETAETLVRLGTNVSVTNNQGDTPLHRAALKGLIETVATLVELGANVSATNNQGDTPLHQAAENGLQETAETLVRLGTNVSVTNNQGDTPLHRAAVNGLKETVETLVRLGANMAAKNNQGDSPLHLAAERGLRDTTTVLVKLGANVSATNNKGDTPLHRAAEQGLRVLVETLVQLGASLSAKNIQGDSPLHRAAEQGLQRTVETLVRLGANLSATNNEGESPLHQAAGQGLINTVITLVRLGANLSAINNKGDSPLHRAAEQGVQETVETLVRLGANLSATNNKDMTPFDLAEFAYRQNLESKDSYGYRDVLLYLKDKHATSNRTSVRSRDVSTKEPASIGTCAEFPWIANPIEFSDLLSKGMYESFDNRVFLAGACNCGKSTLASVLIGDAVPLTWRSTDGLTVYFGRNGINLKTHDMVPLKEDSGSSAVFTRILRGQPNILEQTSQLLVKKPKSHLHNFFEKISNVKRVFQTRTNKKKGVHSDKISDMSITESINEKDPPFEKNIVASNAKECKQEEPIFITNVSKLDHYTVREDILKEVRKGRYIMEIAPSDLVDFGGQRSYDMTHQLFVQHRGSFIIMFNGRYELKTVLKEYPQGDVTSESLIMHWINSILTYCPEGDDIMPMVLFAATHSDFFAPEEAGKRKLHLTKELNSLLRNHEQKKHIFLDTVFFIDGTNIHDPEIKALTKQLVKFAMLQSTWGQKRPMAWVPLELQIDHMRSQNISIITRKQLLCINRLNEDLTLSENQLEDFLLNQHMLGKMLYYNQPGLNGFVIIHTPALVNILRSFITDEMFWPDKEELKYVLQTLVHTGNIYKSNLWKLWRQDSFNQYFPTDELKAFVTKLLIHLDILIHPKSKCSASDDEMFLVPCVIKTSPPPDFFLHGTSDSNTIVLAYSLTVSSIPSALAFRLIGATSNNLCLKTEGEKLCLYHKAAIFMVDDDNEIRMCLERNRVLVNIINKKSLKFLSPDIAASIQECLTKTLESCIAFYYKSNGNQIDQKEISKKFSIEAGVACRNGMCLLDLDHASLGTEWTCEVAKRNHQKKYLMYWFFNQKQNECDQRCSGLDNTEMKTIPSNKHFVRLAGKFGIGLFRDFIINLGLTTQEYLNIQHHYEANGVQSVMFMALVQWKKDITAKLKSPSLKLIADALKVVDMNEHVLCQIFREDTSLNDISENRLQQPVHDDVLRELPTHIGNCVIHLGIELGLTVEDIEAAMYNYPKDMYSQIAYILHKWKTSSQTPTVFALMKGLQNVRSGGLSYLFQKYNVGAKE